MTVPIPVKKFLKKIDVTSATYIFAVATRAATPHRAFHEVDRILRRAGRRLDSFFTLTLPSNDPKFRDWQPPTDDEIAQLESEVQARLDAVRNIIVNRERIWESDTHFIVPVHPLMERLVQLGMGFAEYDGAKDYFYSNSRCTGCGTCAKVCPSGKVRMADRRPLWRKEVKCYMCYACLNFCPVRAVQIKTKFYMKSYTGENERYPHPYATADEIAAQK